MKFNFEKKNFSFDFAKSAKIGALVLIAFLAQSKKSEAQTDRACQLPAKEYLSKNDLKEAPLFSARESVAPKDRIEDPVIARQQELEKNPELIKKAQKEMEATVRAKRKKGEANLSIDELVKYRAETEQLILDLKFNLLYSDESEN